MWYIYVCLIVRDNRDIVIFSWNASVTCVVLSVRCCISSLQLKPTIILVAEVAEVVAEPGKGNLLLVVF